MPVAPAITQATPRQEQPFQHMHSPLYGSYGALGLSKKPELTEGDAGRLPGPPQSQPCYIPQQQQHIMYDQNGEALEISYEYTAITTASSKKKRMPRTLQACNACRNAKAKCTDPKPCQGCRERGIDCEYDPPAPTKNDVLFDVLGLLTDVMDKVGHLSKHVSDINNKLERAPISIKQPEQEIQEKKKEDRGSDFGNDRNRLAKKRLKSTAHHEPEFVEEREDSDDGSESQVTADAPPAESAIPRGHTTGAAKILQWPAVADMLGDIMKRDENIGIDPLRREISRGIIRLYWRGEGVEQSVGADTNSVLDYGLEPPRLNSDTYFEAAHLLPVEPWNHSGQSPVADSFLYRAESEAGAAVDLSGFLKLDERTVRQLASSYMRHLNVMHPIITQKSLDGMIANFMKQDREGLTYNFSTFVRGSEVTSSKRKRSLTVTSADHPYAQHLYLRLQGTISEAIMLLVLALGKICEHRSKIPDVVPENDCLTSNSPPPMHQLPQMSPHSSTLPSPTDSSSDRYPQSKRNFDAIPGLAYFAIATGILGNHAGGTGLPYVHACLLASLYQGQLGRVVQSHAHVKEAGYALTIMLEQHLPRYKQMQEDMRDHRRQADVKWQPEDNRILFTFWTCLQLESDIVAELELPQSSILSLESTMPWPNLAMALDNKEMTENEMRCYSVQLVFRKNLNIIHRDLYGPGKEKKYQLPDMNKLPQFPYINMIIEDLNSVMSANPSLAWRDGDMSPNILEARLRAKMYGAQVITYRHFLRMVVNSQYEWGPDVTISRPIMTFAKKCIDAMFYSVEAFGRIKGGRLVVTNVWGTSHAQWGHIIVLHATYMNSMLRSYVPAGRLMAATKRVREFLVSVAQPSSAIADDIWILDYAVERSGAREAAQ